MSKSSLVVFVPSQKISCDKKTTLHNTINMRFSHLLSLAVVGMASTMYAVCKVCSDS